MKQWLSYIRYKGRAAGVFIIFSLIFLITFALYHLPLKAVLYPILLCSIVGILLLGLDYRRVYKKYQLLQVLKKCPQDIIKRLPKQDSMEECEYQQILCLMTEKQKQIEERMNNRYVDMMEYYTIWAHQIKTPIASMRLNLQNEDSQLSRGLSEDLFRIEQYVEMVLCYLRLDSQASDYVIREYELDGIIKQAIKRLASQFIRKKIRLCYEPLSIKVITDEKWLLFVIEQVLSNALKYTREEGTVTIRMEEPQTLCICDTGIGIAPEDLPRIFEKGYTGYNGRSDKKASGIGLYLSKRICANLGHSISANSSLDSGTVIRIHLEQRKLEVE